MDKSDLKWEEGRNSFIEIVIQEFEFLPKLAVDLY